MLRRQVPDRVPVMPGYGTWYASRALGGDLFDVEQGRMHAGEIVAEITRRYGCENWYWCGYGDSIEQTGSDGHMARSSVQTTIDDDRYVETVTMAGRTGAVETRLMHSRHNPVVQLDGFIKDPARDWPIYHSCMGDDWRWGSATTLADIPKPALDLGVTSFGLTLPVDFWKDLRCDSVLAITDLCDGASVMEEAFEWHRHYSFELLTARLRIHPPPDMIHLQGSSSSLSLISPDIYRKYNLNFINMACALAHAKGVPVQIHHCGRSARLVEILHDMTDVDVIHPLEPPPGGDVSLREVKRRFGDRLVLMGNLNTYQLMLHGSPREVKEAARQCIYDAAEGGGFILTNGDQLGRDTPEENVMAMVEAAHEYGVY